MNSPAPAAPAPALTRPHTVTTSAAPLVLLDLDGTLTDSAPGIMRCAAHALRTMGRPVPSTDELRRFIGPGISESLLAHGVTPELLPEAVAAYREEFAAGGMFENSLFDGVADALVALRDAGCTLGVATSKPHRFAVPICERYGLTDLVDGVWGAPPDDVPSSKATVVADAIASFARDGRFPGAARTVMVGDREHDVHGAATHGVVCLGVRWGYADPGELDAAGAIGVVEQPADLANAVLEQLGLA